MARPRRTRDRTFLVLAAFAAAGGFGAIAAAIVATVISWHNGHPTSTFFFFSLWGLAALAGAGANIMVYFQSGDPPEKPPRGGQRVASHKVLELRPALRRDVEHEREAA